MNYLVLSVLLLLGTAISAAPAEEDLEGIEAKEAPPVFLEGATYQVMMKDGTVFNATAKDFKLVPRVKRKPPRIRVISKIVEKVVEKETFSRYQLSFYAGSGPTDLKFEDGVEEASAVSSKDAVLGIGLGMNYNADWGLQGLLLTNETVMLGVHVNFGQK